MLYAHKINGLSKCVSRSSMRDPVPILCFIPRPRPARETCRKDDCLHLLDGCLVLHQNCYLLSVNQIIYKKLIFLEGYDSELLPSELIHGTTQASVLCIRTNPMLQQEKRGNSQIISILIRYPLISLMGFVFVDYVGMKA